MSVAFYPSRADGRPLERCTCDGGASECARCEGSLNVCTSNALDLLAWLDLPAVEWGEIPAAELAARCRRRLWPEARNVDDARDVVTRGRVVIGGRRSGYLLARCADLLAVAERAGGEWVSWS